jgi:GR25 family glycosyltransferase involved in LPS biosynthesis
MSFLSKYYRPWSLRWIIQRFILVIKQGGFFQISPKTLIIDFKASKKISRSLKNQSISYQFPENQEKTIKQETDRIITCADSVLEDLSLLNAYFDHVFVVNLARRADRRSQMIQKLTRLKIRAEFYPAEDGTNEENLREFADYMNTPIDPENAHELEIKLKRKVIYSPGAWATLKSYRNILLEATARGFDKILCLEDDALFAKNFEELFKQAAEIIPENWMLLYLGASQHSWKSSIDLIYPTGIFQENAAVKYYLPLNTDGAFAVGIRKPAFAFLISEIDKMNCSFDSGALRSATKAYKDQCFVLDPNLVIADVSQSDIRIRRKQSDFAKTARWDLDLYDLR